MTSTQFAINYATGEVTLGTTLTTGKRLTINYWPVQAAGNGFTDNLQQTVVATVEGDFIAQAAALAPPPSPGAKHADVFQGADIARFLEN